jgi:hypothetical protein
MTVTFALGAILAAIAGHYVHRHRTFERYGLQSDAAIRTADQHVGANANSQTDITRGPDIFSRGRAVGYSGWCPKMTKPMLGFSAHLNIPARVQVCCASTKLGAVTQTASTDGRPALSHLCGLLPAPEGSLRHRRKIEYSDSPQHSPALPGFQELDHLSERLKHNRRARPAAKPSRGSSKVARNARVLSFMKTFPFPQMMSYRNTPGKINIGI